jgi:hypothetical protein
MNTSNPPFPVVDPQELLRKIKKDNEEFKISSERLLTELTEEIKRFTATIDQVDKQVQTDVEDAAKEVDALAKGLKHD